MTSQDKRRRRSKTELPFSMLKIVKKLKNMAHSIQEKSMRILNTSRAY